MLALCVEALPNLVFSLIVAVVLGALAAAPASFYSRMQASPEVQRPFRWIAGGVAAVGLVIAGVTLATGFPC